MKMSLFCVVALASVFTVGCGLTENGFTHVDPLPAASGKGTLVLTLNSGTLLRKTLEPPISMEIASFDIRGTGPDPVYDQFEDLGNATGQLSVNLLNPGLWTITADARNAAGTIIGFGQSDLPVLISAATVTSAQIDVSPLSGTGALELIVEWTKGAHPNAAVECSLISMSTGADLAPVFSLIPPNDPMKTTYRNTAIEAGYYLLLLRLYDEGGAVLGDSRGCAHRRRANHEQDLDHELRQHAFHGRAVRYLEAG